MTRRVATNFLCIAVQGCRSSRVGGRGAAGTKKDRCTDRLPRGLSERPMQWGSGISPRLRLTRHRAGKSESNEGRTNSVIAALELVWLVDERLVWQESSNETSSFDGAVSALKSATPVFDGIQ